MLKKESIKNKVFTTLLILIICISSLNLNFAYSTDIEGVNFATIDSNDNTKEITSTTLNAETGKLKISKWNGESWFTLGMTSLPLSTSEVTKGKYKQQYLSFSTNIYEIKNGLEYEIVLPSSPIGDKITGTYTFNFLIDSQNVRFNYQPPLTLEYKSGYIEEFGEDCIVTSTKVTGQSGKVYVYRPENIVGSYSVYGFNKDNKYGTGKIGHIYRPMAIDANNDWIWGELFINDGILSIIISSSWLKNAKYPVTIDPAIGYTTAGGSTVAVGQYDVTAISVTPTTSGAVTNLFVYCTSINALIMEGIMWESSGFIVANGITASIVGSQLSPVYVWEKLTFATAPLITGGSDYWIGVNCGNAYTIAYDAGSTDYVLDTTLTSHVPNIICDVYGVITVTGQRDYSIFGVYIEYVTQTQTSNTVTSTNLTTTCSTVTPATSTTLRTMSVGTSLIDSATTTVTSITSSSTKITTSVLSCLTTSAENTKKTGSTTVTRYTNTLTTTTWIDTIIMSFSTSTCITYKDTLTLLTSTTICVGTYTGTYLYTSHARTTVVLSTYYWQTQSTISVNISMRFTVQVSGTIIITVPAAGTLTGFETTCTTTTRTDVTSTDTTCSTTTSVDTTCTTTCETSETCITTCVTTCTTSITTTTNQTTITVPEQFPDNLIQHLRFDEGVGDTAYDSSGNSNDGTLTDGVAWGVGQGGAYGFDISESGVADYPRVLGTIGGAGIPVAFTWMSWIKILPNGSYQFVHPMSFGNGHEFTMYVNDARGEGPYSLRLKADGAIESLLGSIDANTWYHVAVGYDGTNYFGYINGVSVLNSAEDAPSFTNNNFAYGLSGDNCWHGELDDIYLFNRALTGAEINQIMNLSTVTSTTTCSTFETCTTTCTSTCSTFETCTTTCTSTCSTFETCTTTCTTSYETSETCTTTCTTNKTTTETCTTTCTSTTSAETSILGMVLYFPFSNNTEPIPDLSGYNNDGTNVGATWVPEHGGAYSFDDADSDQIQVNDVPEFKYKGAGFAFSVWFKINSTMSGKEGFIISKPWNGNGYYNYRLFKTSADKLNIFIGGDTAESWNTPDVITLDVWHNVVVVFDSDKSVKLYLDGVLVINQSQSIATWIPSGGGGDLNVKLVIADVYPGEPDAGRYCFHGLIDEVRIYDRALSVDEVAILYGQFVQITSCTTTCSTLQTSTTTCTTTCSIDKTTTTTCTTSIETSKTSTTTCDTSIETSNTCTTTCSTDATCTTTCTSTCSTYNTCTTTCTTSVYTDGTCTTTCTTSVETSNTCTTTCSTDNSTYNTCTTTCSTNSTCTTSCTTTCSTDETTTTTCTTECETTTAYPMTTICTTISTNIVTTTCLTTTSGVAGSTRMEYYTVGGAAWLPVGSTYVAAQIFIPTSDYKIVGVKLFLYREGTPGTLTIGIRDSAGGVPTGGDLTSGTFDSSLITDNTNGDWYYIPITPYDLTDGTNYAIVASCPNNYVYWLYDGTSPGYDDGQVAFSSNSGASFTGYASMDFIFEVYAEDAGESTTIETTIVTTVDTSTCSTTSSTICVTTTVYETSTTTCSTSTSVNTTCTTTCTTNETTTETCTTTCTTNETTTETCTTTCTTSIETSKTTTTTCTTSIETSETCTTTCTTFETCTTTCTTTCKTSETCTTTCTTSIYTDETCTTTCTTSIETSQTCTTTCSTFETITTTSTTTCETSETCTTTCTSSCETSTTITTTCTSSCETETYIDTTCTSSCETETSVITTCTSSCSTFETITTTCTTTCSTFETCTTTCSTSTSINTTCTSTCSTSTSVNTTCTSTCSTSTSVDTTCTTSCSTETSETITTTCTTSCVTETSITTTCTSSCSTDTSVTTTYTTSCETSTEINSTCTTTCTSSCITSTTITTTCTSSCETTTTITTTCTTSCVTETSVTTTCTTSCSTDTSINTTCTTTTRTDVTSTETTCSTTTSIYTTCTSTCSTSTSIDTTCTSSCSTSTSIYSTCTTTCSTSIETSETCTTTCTSSCVTDTTITTICTSNCVTETSITTTCTTTCSTVCITSTSVTTCITKTTTSAILTTVVGVSGGWNILIFVLVLFLILVVLIIIRSKRR